MLPGIANQYMGKAPDCGAHEKGAEPPWRAGHDFANPPKAAYKPSDTPPRNHLRNSGFELARVTRLPVGDELQPWLKTHAKAARLALRRGVSKAATGPKWPLVALDFTTGAPSSSATVYILKQGGGTAFADDIGLFPPGPPSRRPSHSPPSPPKRAAPWPAPRQGQHWQSGEVSRRAVLAQVLERKTA